MFDDDLDFYGFGSDLDGDGDSDLFDRLLADDLLREEEEELESKFDRSYSHSYSSAGEDDDEDEDEYEADGLDIDEYETADGDADGFTAEYVVDDAEDNDGADTEVVYTADAGTFSWHQRRSTSSEVDPRARAHRSGPPVTPAEETARPERMKRLSSEPEGTQTYRFCKVSLDFPAKPHFYYLVGSYAPAVNDRVLVSFGAENEIVEGVVTAVGECMGLAFPCPVDKVKTIIKIVR